MVKWGMIMARCCFRKILLLLLIVPCTMRSAEREQQIEESALVKSINNLNVIIEDKEKVGEKTKTIVVNSIGKAIRNKIMAVIDKNRGERISVDNFPELNSLNDVAHPSVVLALIGPLFMEYFKEIVGQTNTKFEANIAAIMKQSHDGFFSASFTSAEGVKIVNNDLILMYNSEFGKGEPFKSVVFGFSKNDEFFVMSDGKSTQILSLPSLELVENFSENDYQGAQHLWAWSVLVDAYRTLNYENFMQIFRAVTLEQAIFICRIESFWRQFNKPFVISQDSTESYSFNSLDENIRTFLAEVDLVKVEQAKDSEQQDEIEQDGDKAKNNLRWKKWVSFAGMSLAAALGAYRLYQYVTRTTK
jgi:hypothetical protein